MLYPRYVRQVEIRARDWWAGLNIFQRRLLWRLSLADGHAAKDLIVRWGGSRQYRLYLMLTRSREPVLSPLGSLLYGHLIGDVPMSVFVDAIEDAGEVDVTWLRRASCILYGLGPRVSIQLLDWAMTPEEIAAQILLEDYLAKLLRPLAAGGDGG